MDEKAPPSAGLYDFLGWIETNKKQLAFGGGGVLLGLLIFGIWVWHRGESARDAEQALASVRMPYSPLETPAPGTADTLAKIAAEYPKTPAAAKALLRAGTVYFGDGNYVKAREQFEAYMRDFGDTPWVPQAMFGYAVCLEAENKTGDAISKYKDFISAHGSDAAADQARLNLARLYEQTGQPHLALDTLTKMTDPQKQSSATPEAQARLRALLTKNPSLIPTNPAPPRPPSQPPISITPQGGTPQPIPINPSQPTPGQPNQIQPNPDNRPQIFLPGQPVPPQPAPVKPTPPAQPTPGQPTPAQPTPPATPPPGQPTPAPAPPK